MTNISEEAQSLSPSGIVSLFSLDTSSVGGPVLYFTQGVMGNNAPIKHGGIEYLPADIEFEGLEIAGAGALPTPIIRVSNSDGLAQAILNTWGDLNGCVVRRIRTHVRFLDGQPDADPNVYYGPDIFRVERKTAENSVYIEWELSAAIDQEGKKLPGRQIIRDTCLWRYRYYDPATHSFDYSKAQCPYTGNQYFDAEDNPVLSPADDMPSRRLNCCRVRFGSDAPLPFGGFPGVARVA